MKYTLHISNYFSILLIFFCGISCLTAQKKGVEAYKPDFTDAYEAKEASWYNKGHSDGYKKGKKQGRAEGIMLAQKKAWQEGFEAGFGDCRRVLTDSIYRVLKDILLGLNPNTTGMLDQILKDWRADASTVENIRIHASQEGYDKGFIDGYREGLNASFDSLYTLSLRHGQNIEYPSARGVRLFTLDYEKIVRLMSSISGSKTYVEQSLFSDALHEVNIAILEYLTQIVPLKPEERDEVFETYGKIHAPLAERSYQSYLKMCQTLNRNYDKNFYDYRYTVSTNAFIHIVNFNICSVADICFTYAKGDSQFAAWAGFELGSISEIIMENIAIPLGDYFQKNAIRLDYDTVFQALIPTTINLINPLIAETRTHREIITESVVLSPEHTAFVTMEIETIVELGYWLEDFNIVPDHRIQKVLVNISNRPRLLRVVHQDYKVLEVQNAVVFRSNCSFTTTLSKGILDAIFERHRKPAIVLDICQKPLGRAAISLISPILAKSIEPAVAIPYSCYDVRLNFGNRSSNLIKVGCP